MSVPIAIPVGATALRPSWAQLPVSIRTGIETAVGSAVTSAASQTGGFTPGFASRLELADGRRYFVKAADRRIDWLADAYATESEVLALLPPSVSAPRVQYRLDLADDAQSWLVVVFDDVGGRAPTRPWTYAEAQSVLTAATETSRLLTPAPPNRTWAPFVGDDFGSDGSDVTSSELAGRIGELVQLAPQLLTGSTLVHNDLRDDNVILGDDGRIWFCDWNWPTVGPAWIDAACLSIAMVGDGLDPDRLFADCSLLAAADPAAVDTLLALLLAYFTGNGAKPPAEGSPHIRSHQRWYAEVIERWLRRRWDA